MKNLIILITLAIAIMACEKEEVKPSVETKTKTEYVQENLKFEDVKWTYTNLDSTYIVDGHTYKTIDQYLGVINTTYCIYKFVNNKHYYYSKYVSLVLNEKDMKYYYMGSAYFSIKKIF